MPNPAIVKAFHKGGAIDEDVLAVLGWTEPGMSETEVLHVTEGARARKLYISRQPAAFVVSGEAALSHENLRNAASYCYHAELEWGLALSAGRAMLFNAFWVKGDSWYALPEFSVENIEESSRLIELFSPKELVRGSLTDEAFAKWRPDRILQPVDEDLVDRLDYWRTETLRHVKVVEEQTMTFNTYMHKCSFFDQLKTDDSENCHPYSLLQQKTGWTNRSLIVSIGMRLNKYKRDCSLGVHTREFQNM